MLRRLSVQMAPITNRAAEYAPMAPACCNLCRTCTTSNLLGLMFGGATVGVLAVGRVARRVLKTS